MAYNNNHFVPRLVLRRYKERLSVFNIRTGELKENNKLENIFSEQKLYDEDIEIKLGKGSCDINKFIGYIFSDKYAWNGKRDLFESLGFSIEDSQYLKKEFERQAVEKYCNSQYVLGKLDENGQRINIDVSFQKADRSITFVFGWMVRQKGYITCNTPLGG